MEGEGEEELTLSPCGEVEERQGCHEDGDGPHSAEEVTDDAPSSL